MASSASSPPERVAPKEPASERATGSADPAATDVQPVEHPDLRGTLFIMTVFLMMIFGFWLLMYFELLSR